MKILVICQYYYPEPFRISDICEELAARGHEITVVTGTPNYPMGKVYSGYEGDAKQDECLNGVYVHRCKIHPRKSGAVHRLWNYLSYPYQSCKYIDTLDDSFDIVFIYQLSPVMMAKAGLQYARKRNKKSVLYCLDIWPASLSAGKITDGLIYSFFCSISASIYKAAGRIIATSKLFSGYFSDQFGLDDIGYLPQYAEEIFSCEQCRKTPDEYLDLMFAGNVGAAQGVDTIIRAAALCRDDKTIRWHIVGDGKELAYCKKLAQRLSAPVCFYGRKSLAEMPAYYSMADAMLVTMQRNPMLDMTLPGKVQSYMSAGKPIVGAIDGETKHIIDEAACGVCAAAGNYAQLAELVREIAANKDRLIPYGTASERYSRENFSKEAFINTLEGELEQ